MLSTSKPGIAVGIAVAWAAFKAARGAGTRLQPPQPTSEEHLLPGEVRMSSSNPPRTLLSSDPVPNVLLM